MIFLRSLAGILLILIGIFLAAFGAVVASGWGHRDLSIIAIAQTVIGYLSTFGGYRFMRKSDWEPVVAAVIKFVLLLGSALLIVGTSAYILHGELVGLPRLYCVVTGCASLVGYAWFRKYAD